MEKFNEDDFCDVKTLKRDLSENRVSKYRQLWVPTIGQDPVQIAPSDFRHIEVEFSYKNCILFMQDRRDKLDASRKRLILVSTKNALQKKKYALTLLEMSS